MAFDFAQGLRDAWYLWPKIQLDGDHQRLVYFRRGKIRRGCWRTSASLIRLRGGRGLPIEREHGRGDQQQGREDARPMDGAARGRRRASRRTRFVPVFCHELQPLILEMLAGEGLAKTFRDELTCSSS